MGKLKKLEIFKSFENTNSSSNYQAIVIIKHCNPLILR